MVTTTVGMLDWILGDTANLWPAITLHSKFVVGATGLQHWLVNSSTAGYQAQRCSVATGVELFDSRWKLHSSSAGIRVVRDNSAVATGSLGDPTAIAGLLLERAHDGAFWHLADWHDVTDAELGLLTAVHELAGAEAFRADHGLRDFSVFVWVLELDLGEWCATAWIVHDILHETLDEALSLGVVERTELGGALSSLRSGGEN